MVAGKSLQSIRAWRGEPCKVVFIMINWIYFFTSSPEKNQFLMLPLKRQ
mgnify:CR=1 FL=1